MRESVPLKRNFSQRNILVQGLKENGFYVFRKEIVCEPDFVYIFVVLKGVYKVDESSIVQTAR